MKRCIEWLKSNVTWSEQEILAGLLSLVIAILVSVLTFVRIDKVPATVKNYEPLKKQWEDFKENPVQFFRMKGNTAYIREDGVIQITFENEQCKLIVNCDQDFTALSTELEDNYYFWPFAMGAVFILGICIYVVVYALIVLVILIGSEICEFLKRLKVKYTKK